MGALTKCIDFLGSSSNPKNIIMLYLFPRITHITLFNHVNVIRGKLISSQLALLDIEEECDD